jgi:hypothetical protein
MVIVSGSIPDTAALPTRPARERAGRGARAGDELDADGGAEVFHQFATTDLPGFTAVHVLDATGAVVLTGVVDRPA